MEKLSRAKTLVGRIENRTEDCFKAVFNTTHGALTAVYNHDEYLQYHYPALNACKHFGIAAAALATTLACAHGLAGVWGELSEPMQCLIAGTIPISLLVAVGAGLFGAINVACALEK